MKIFFITGGVISGLGKGVTTASIGAVLQAMGYKIRIKKLDPYLNVDPGTMNPVEHGEVYVTDDGGETDLDLGYYERFTGIPSSKKNSTSSGKLLDTLIKKERAGNFLGKTVQINPHFTKIIKEFIEENNGEDIILCEIGGSAGDIEAAPFYESIRQLKVKYKNDAILCTLVYLVYYKASKEIKTKPAQVALSQYREKGLTPDIVFARSEYIIEDHILTKLSKSVGIPLENIIPAMNVPSIYNVPMEYIKEGLVDVLNSLGIKTKKKLNMTKWIDLNKRIGSLKKEVIIGIVGKYIELEDAYYSVIESLNHAGWMLETQVNIKWINARDTLNLSKELNDVDGILVPGGFGTSGVESIISSIKYARINKVPFMGICFGMQLSVIEFARNVLDIKKASSEEFGKPKDTFIVGLMKEWKTEKGTTEKRNKECDLGGTLRLGTYKQKLKPRTLIYSLYNNKDVVYERHRHRYEVDIKYKDMFEKKGMIFSGLSLDGMLPEMIELDKKIHPFFIAMQGHPEFKSSPFEPRPFFIGLIKAALTYKKASNKPIKKIVTSIKTNEKIKKCPKDSRRSSMIG